MWFQKAEPNPIPKNPEDDFDFSVLWQDEEAGGLMKYLPLASLLLNLVILIILLVKM